MSSQNLNKSEIIKVCISVSPTPARLRTNENTQIKNSKIRSSYTILDLDESQNGKIILRIGD